MPPSPQFEPPVVVALFPTYAALCWAHPRAATSKAFAEHTSWEYQVEYSCSCRLRHHPYAMSTADTFALVATPHHGEVYYVRVVAKATLAGSTAALVSSKLAFTAAAAGAPRWSAESPSPCVFDALFLCAAQPCEDLAALTASRKAAAQHRCSIDDSRRHVVLEGEAEFALYRASYDSAVPPMGTRTVFYLTASGGGPRVGQRPQPQRMRSRDVAALLQRESAALVLCGVGGSGRLAIKAAHGLLSSLMTSEPAACAAIFCVTYGTPRCFLRDGAKLLAHTLPHSDHFLHVTQRRLEDGGCGVTESAALAWRSLHRDVMSVGAAGCINGFYKNVLLGVQCSVAQQEYGGGGRLVFRPSCPDDCLTVEEVEELYDVDSQLGALARVFFSPSQQWLAPSIHSISCRTAGPLLYCVVDGVNLHYAPRLTLLPPQHVPLFPRLTECSPHRLCAVGSLLEWVEAAATATPHAGELSLCALLQTTHGTAVCAAAAAARLPGDLVELWRRAAHATVPWATAAPPSLVEAVVQMQPLHALCQQAGTGAAALSPSAEILCALASAAETALAERGRSASAAAKASGSVLGFMSDVAARFTTAAATAAAGDAAARLSVPGKEAAFLRNAIREWVGNTAKGMEVWQLRSASWQQRVLHGLSPLHERSYRTTLLRLLRCFDRHAETYGEAPYLWLEARLYTHTRLHVSQQLSTVPDMDGLLADSMTLSDFYSAARSVFMSDAPKLDGGLPCVYECVLLWSVCHTFELRRELSRTHVCVAVGCPGCGASTLAASLASLVCADDAFGYAGSAVRRRVLTCRLPATRLPALHLALQHGAGVTVFLAGEAGDPARPQYAAMHMAIQESAAGSHQHVFRVLTKADEQLPRLVASSSAAAPAVPSASRFLAEALAAAYGGGGPADERCVAVSLAASPSMLSQALGRPHEEGGALAVRLREASQLLLRQCLRSSLEHTEP